MTESKTVTGSGAGGIPSTLTPEMQEHIRTLKTRLAALVTQKFEGDYKKAFAYYSQQKGGLGKEELKLFLKDADIGNMLTRGAWADGILDALDGTRNKALEWDEFSQTIHDTLSSDPANDETTKPLYAEKKVKLR